MSTLSIRLPESLHKQLRELAKTERASINQIISAAVAEKLAALLTPEYLEGRARRGSRKKFDAVLQAVPDVAKKGGHSELMSPVLRRKGGEERGTF